MANLKSFRASGLLEVFFDGVLLLGFIAQAFVGSCLLFHGYLPIPAAWANRLLADKMPEGLHLQVATARLNSGHISFTGLEVYSKEVQRPLLSIESTDVELDWSRSGLLPELNNISVTGGTLYMPSTYAPSGRHEPLLERIAFTLKLGESGWQVERLAALHEGIYLWGSVSLPQRQPVETLSIPELTDQFYTRAAALSGQKARLEHFETPTIVFDAHPSSEGKFMISVDASSPNFNHPEIEAQNIRLRGRFIWGDGMWSTLEAPVFSVSQLNAPRYQLETTDARIHIAREDFALLVQGEWPRLRLAASELKLSRFNLDAPILGLNATDFPNIDFRGAAGGLGGAIALDGRINARNWSGAVRARGNVDLAELVAESTRKRLPEIRFHSPPYYDLRVSFGKGFSLTDAEIDAQIEDLQVEDLRFDQIRTEGRYTDGRYFVDSMYLSRGKQWIDLTFSLDQASRDYRASLDGSVIPNEYNNLLPEWWTAIFRDFDFERADYSKGDFIIYGNTERKAADLYYGHAEAKRVAYRGLLLNEGELIVRGRGPYTELRDLKLTSEDGWARGNIAFASKLDAIKGPASVRLDLEAQLPPADAGRLFDGKVASLIGDFQTEALPEIKLQATLYNQDYSEYEKMSHYTLWADCPGPITYKGIPFDQLTFQLHGRANEFHLRDLRFGYANGRGNALLDIATPPEQPPHIRYKLKLTEAEQNRALTHLPQFGKIKQSLQPGDRQTPENKNRDGKTALIDLHLHGQGPTVDIWSHEGAGRFEIRNERLATIQLLGPLSKLLQRTQLNFTSFNLDTMHGDFAYTGDRVYFDPLQIDGLRTKIQAPGTLNLRDQTIDMRMSVFLFGNAGNPDSRLRKFGDFLKRPIPNLLEFELTGTLQDQKIRSLYDPRNLLPDL